MAHAWDAHHWVTQYALRGFDARNPALARALDTPIAVHPISSFLAKAYGASCQWPKFRDGALEGLGQRYQIEYTEGARTQLELDWGQGFSFGLYSFLPAPQPGGSTAATTTPREVLTVYSDEPDWNMDDDVPRLKNVGITDGIAGMGTRVLRHFWYEGQDEMGVSLSDGQELDHRVADFARVSRLAFSVGEPYWGFRFLADELHYLQDLTQPFHVQAIMSDEMIYTLQGAEGALCDFRRGLRKGNWVDDRGEDCAADQSVHGVVIKSGWLTSTYHSIYEDFERGLVESNVQSTRDWITDPAGNHQRFEGVEKLDLPPAGTPLDAPGAALAMVRQAQGVIVGYADAVSAGMLGTFTNSYRFDASSQKTELLKSTHADSIGYEMGAASFYGPPGYAAFGPASGIAYERPLDPSQSKAKAALVDATHAVLARAGAWTRALVEKGVADGSLTPPPATGCR